MLTNRRQQQAIADLIHGLTPDINTEEMQDPFDFLWGIVVDCSVQESYQQLIGTKMSVPDLAGIGDDILSVEQVERQLQARNILILAPDGLYLDGQKSP